MTPRLIGILSEVARFHEANGYAPSLADIGSVVGLSSKSTVRVHLSTLRHWGYVDWNPTTARSVRLTDAGKVYLWKIDKT